MTKCTVSTLRRGLCLAAFTLFSSCLFAAKTVNLGDYADLTDLVDDSAALLSAIIDAGDGGTVKVPAGTVMIETAVVVSDVSINIVGAGISVTDFQFNYAATGPGSVGLKLRATSASTVSLDWSIRDIRFVAGAASQGTALSFVNNAVATRSVSASVERCFFESGRNEFFQRGVTLSGVNKASLRSTNFIGQLGFFGTGTSGGTSSNIYLTGDDCGDVSIFECHTRDANVGIDVDTGFDSLYLRRVWIVRSIEKSLRVDSGGGANGSLIVHGCSLLSNERNIEVFDPLDSVRISSIRTKVKGSSSSNPTGGAVDHVALFEDCDNLRIASNFLRNGIELKDCSSVSLFGNHFWPADNMVEIEDSSDVYMNNNIRELESNYSDLYEVLGTSGDVYYTDKILLQ